MFPILVVIASCIMAAILLQLEQVIMAAARGCSFDRKPFTKLLASDIQWLETQQHTGLVVVDGVIVNDDPDSNTLHPFNVSR